MRVRASVCACMRACVLSDVLKCPVLVDGLSSIHAMFVQLIRMSTSDLMCTFLRVCLSGVLRLIGISTSAHLCVCVCCF